MQPDARQLQQLDYNNGNGGVFYVVRAEELSWRQLGWPSEGTPNQQTHNCQTIIKIWS
jgi:hypothetical protein